MLACHVLPCVAPARPQPGRRDRNRSNTCRVLQVPDSGAHGPVEHAAREALRHVSETERDAAVSDLRSRLRGWPDQPCSLPQDDQRHAASVGITKRWYIDQASELEVQLSSGVTDNAEAHPQLRLRATLRTSSSAATDAGPSVKLSWELVPHAGSSDGSGTLSLTAASSASSRSGTASLLPRAGTQGIAFRLHMGDEPAQALLLPTVAGLLSQLAAVRSVSCAPTGILSAAC